MSLADCMGRVSTRLGTLVPTTFKTVYAKPPQAAPADNMLPAVFVRPVGGPVSYSASQRQVNHTLELVALVKRSANLPNDYDAAVPLVEPLIELWEQYTQLGSPTYYDARVTNIDIGPAGFNVASDVAGDAQYVAVVATLTVKEKKAVTMA